MGSKRWIPQNRSTKDGTSQGQGELEPMNLAIAALGQATPAEVLLAFEDAARVFKAAPTSANADKLQVTLSALRALCRFDRGRPGPETDGQDDSATEDRDADSDELRIEALLAELEVDREGRPSASRPAPPSG